MYRLTIKRLAVEQTCLYLLIAHEIEAATNRHAREVDTTRREVKSCSVSLIAISICPSIWDWRVGVRANLDAIDFGEGSVMFTTTISTSTSRVPH